LSITDDLDDDVVPAAQAMKSIKIA